MSNRRVQIINLTPLPEKFFSKDAAIHKATVRVPVVAATASLGQIIVLLQTHIHSFDTIDYIYLINEQKKVVGAVAIKDIYNYPPSTQVINLWKDQKLISITPDTSQEYAAYVALKHNLKVVPLVNKKHELVGVINAHTLLNILYKEMREDLALKSGIHEKNGMLDNVLQIPIVKSLQHRVPWLLIGLGGGLVLANIIGYFELTLQKNLILAAFIPLIVYMSDAVRVQVETFTIRDLAVERTLPILKYTLRHISIMLCMALGFGLLLFGVGVLFYRSIVIGMVLGISLIIAMLSSITTGLFIPYTFSRLKFDPANMSGPIGTILQDTVSVVIYFSTATWLLG